MLSFFHYTICQFTCIAILPSDIFWFQCSWVSLNACDDIVQGICAHMVRVSRRGMHLRICACKFWRVKQLFSVCIAETRSRNPRGCYWRSFSEHVINDTPFRKLPAITAPRFSSPIFVQNAYVCNEWRPLPRLSQPFAPNDSRDIRRLFGGDGHHIRHICEP